MAEDSGTFKTNPRNSARFRHFVMGLERRGNDASSPAENAIRRGADL
jgi:hypothetical protein